jgi:hypothetical protein
VKGSVAASCPPSFQPLCCLHGFIRSRKDKFFHREFRHDNSPSNFGSRHDQGSKKIFRSRQIRRKGNTIEIIEDLNWMQKKEDCRSVTVSEGSAQFSGDYFLSSLNDLSGRNFESSIFVADFSMFYHLSILNGLFCADFSMVYLLSFFSLLFFPEFSIVYLSLDFQSAIFP